MSIHVVMICTCRRGLASTLLRMLLAASLLTLSACGMLARGHQFNAGDEASLLKPNTETYKNLTALPKPRGQVIASVYSFRDMTGQYKEAPNSNISTAVTQGASSMLVQALKDSGWFIIVEREGFQHLLTERKISRANNNNNYPKLLPANIIFEGGIIAYDTNVLTGGEGVKYLGIGGSEQYRMDQVTIALRAVDVRSGRVLDTVETTKTILSYKFDVNAYLYVSFKDILQAETGVSVNEPVQLCAQEAIHLAVVNIIARGIKQGFWKLASPEDIKHPAIQKYLGNESSHKASRLKAEQAARLKAEQASRLKAEQASRLKAEQAARLRAEQASRLKAEQASRLKAEQASRLKAEQASRLKTEKAASKEVIRTDQLWATVLVRPGSMQLTGKTRNALAKLVGQFMAYPSDATLEIRGYTDDEPVGGYQDNRREPTHPFKTNIALSEARAHLVANALIEAGIPNDRIHVRGYGAKNFVASNKTAKERAKNRRIEIHLIKQ